MKRVSYFLRPVIGLSIVVISLLSGAAQAEVAYRLSAIEAPSDPGYYLSVIRLNNKGEVVGFVESNGIRAFHWKNGVYTDLSDALGLNSRELEAVGINDRSVIVGNRGDGAPRTFRIRNNQLRPINVSPGGDVAGVNGINNRNQVLGYSQGQPFIWFRGVTTYLDGLPGSDEFSNRANALNDFGVATGLSGTLDGQSAVIWKNGEIIVLDSPPGAIYTSGADINNLEQVVGNGVDAAGQTRAYIWNDGVRTALPAATTDATNVGVAAINNWGVSVGTTSGPSGFVATLWIAGKAVDLNTLIDDDDPLHAAVTLSGALLINDRGQIVARGSNSTTNRSYSYLLTPSYKPQSPEE